VNLKRTGFLSGAFAAGATLAYPRAARAGDARTVKIGTLKLIHSMAPQFYEQFVPAGVRVEVIPFDSPPDGKNGLVSGAVDFGNFGLAAATLGAAAGEPVVVIAATCNKGMGIVVGKDSGIATIAQLKGKKVAYQTGSTQEVVFREECRKANLVMQTDVQLIRLSFGDMANALARGDVDAYVGAEPGPSISVTSGKGKVLSFPYDTPVGSVNMVFATRPELLKNDLPLVKSIVKMHAQATAHAGSPKNKAEFIEKTVKTLGIAANVVDYALPNVDLSWRIDDAYRKRAEYYGAQMLELKQIAKLPNYNGFIDTSVLASVGKV
jgi:NitT/TauT family transport system substrate-binding protein